MKQPRIGVLCGGVSPERDVSLVSGEHVHAALMRLGHNAQLIRVDDLDRLVEQLAGIDRVFNVLHGGAGEDGTVRLLLDVMEVPCTGSSAQACARAMDKSRSKALFELMNVSTPIGVRLEPSHGLETSHAQILEEMSFPLVVKPNAAGSTLGVRIVHDAAALDDGVQAVFTRYGDALVETFVPGRELTVGVLDDNGQPVALPVVEIRMPNELFDYQAKYTDGVAEFIVPAPLDEQVADYVQTVGVRAHEVLGCTGYSRVDIRLGHDGIAYVLEANTSPGMTQMSDLPRAAAAAGIDFEALVARMLATARKDEP